MNIKLKMVLLGIIPVVIALAVVTFFVQRQAQGLITKQAIAIEEQVIAEKRNELINYTELALTSIEPFLSVDISDAAEYAKAKDAIKLILENLTFSDDGYFFVYDMNGTNILHPKQPWRVGENWLDLQDDNGVFIIRDLLSMAQKGGGFVTYTWERPSTGTGSQKLSYAAPIDAFGWMVGTGVYLEAVDAQISELRSDVASRVRSIFWLITVLVAFVVIAISGITSILAFRETSFADEKLRELYNEMVVVQEEERKRVSRELHDGISQLLVSAKYAMALARTRLQKRNLVDVDEMDTGFERIDEAIHEVRRISVGLRPKDLDDLGLAAALQSLTQRVSESCDLRFEVNVEVVNDLLSIPQKSALYRVAQEAFTNVQRHAKATRVQVNLSVERNAVVLEIVDNGCGLTPVSRKNGTAHNGVGLRNMEERVARFGGILSVRSRGDDTSGARLVAEMPFAQSEALSRKIQTGSWFNWMGFEWRKIKRRS